jgi:DNA-binding HxlR family transcriptional regulator
LKELKKQERHKKVRRFRELMEASDTMVFAFGRFNPPTTGHEKLIKKVSAVSGSDPFRIYPSHTTNPKKDPLPHALKIAYMRKMFKRYGNSIVADKGARTAIEIAVKVYDEGYKNIKMVVGSDRIKDFSSMLNKYNGVEGKPHGYYKFDNIDIVSAGERDPDSEGVEGMSASKMRGAAVGGDKDSFLQGVPSDFRDGEKLYRDVRKYMGIREERNMGDMTDFETLRDQYLTGKIWNVGETVVVEGVEGEIVRKGTNYLSYMTEDGKVHKAWLHQIEERNYSKEYANYHSQPEQIARRSSRNKARRVMGDKTKVGMDVGHRDNNPLNNDPKNLKNETPSKNRREPRLREIKKSSIGTSRGVNAAKAMIDEMSWYNELIAKISQMKHPTGYERMAKAYAAKMREKEYEGKPGHAINDIVRQIKGIRPRQLAAYINKLVDKGIFPKELKAEYEPIKEEKLWSFKEFVNQIQETKSNKKDLVLDEKVEELIKKSENSDIPYSTLKEIYDQGRIKHKENPKPGTTPHQWGLGAVDKFINEKSIDLNNSNERPKK